MKTAIVTTLVNAGKVLDTFVRYHLSIGFDHIFLFFDDEHDPSISQAAAYKKVTIIKYDEDLVNRWEETQSFLYHHQFISREVMSRQILNNELAIKLCLENNIDWLLHIDIDELFFLETGNVREHFLEMESQKKFYLRYLNHEAIPEQLGLEDYFREVTLFKRNFQTLEPKAQALVKRMLGRDQYFLFYGNGKSAIRVHSGLKPISVRDYECEFKMFTVTNPSILHFPCCGIDHFQSKYHTLSNFSDRWFGRTEISRSVPVHAKSRDIYKTMDSNLISKYYTNVFLKQHARHKDAFLEANIFFREDISKKIGK